MHEHQTILRKQNLTDRTFLLAPNLEISEYLKGRGVKTIQEEIEKSHERGILNRSLNFAF